MRPRHRVDIVDIAILGESASAATVRVTMLVDGAPRHLELDLVPTGFIGTSWWISNIRYPGGVDLVAHRRRLAGE